MPENTSVVLLDLGRVVFDLDFDLIWEQWSRLSGVDADELSRRFEQDTTFPDYDSNYRDYERGHMSAENYLVHFNQRLDTSFTLDEFLLGWNAMFTDPIDGMYELLCDIKTAQIPLFAFSNTNADHELIWRKRYAGSIDQFDKVYTSHGLGHRKPDQAAFAAVVSEIGVAARDVLFFDDLHENVKAARHAGLRAEVFTDTPSARTIINKATDHRLG